MSVNAKIASILYEIGEILTVKGDRFRSRAYNMAAQRVTALTEDIEAINERNELEKIPGVGKSIALTIKEVLETGESRILEDLKESLPKGVPEMIELEGIGPRIALRLHQELGIVSIKTLEEAATKQKIRELKGFGPKKEENILQAIKEYHSRSTRFLLGEVLPIIEGILIHMRDHQKVRKVEAAGSARRRKETVGDLDILVSTEYPNLVSNHFIEMKPVSRVLSQGPTKSQVILKNQLQVDLRAISPQSYGAALQYFTGSKEHNVKLRTISVKAGYKLNEYGLFTRDTNELVAAENEEQIYSALGMEWIPPELRENTGEIEAAMEDYLPELVTYEKILGDLHVHSNWSDGVAEIGQLVEKGIEMGHEYIAITDHTKGLAIANGLDEKRLKNQVKEIGKINEKYPDFRVITGTECDILSNGKLDLKNEVLKDIEFVIASIHSGFKQDSESMTQRIIDAIHNDNVNAIGHPTGRLIQKRSPYTFDFDKVMETAAEQKVAMEINCYPRRLDLKDVDSRRAKAHGVKMMLGSDAHTTSEMEFLPLGVSVARRGWLTQQDIINSFCSKEIIAMRN
jgi:DNA polymerase (family 10)